MSMTLFKNATLVNDGQSFKADLLVEDQRIARIADSIEATEGVDVIDASGKYLLPGMIDDQVHFREPGTPHKADMHTESRAAVAGGITSFMDMPNTNPQTVTVEALEDKFKLAADRCYANYAFYMGTTNDNLDEIRKLGKNQTCGIKVFMGASTGNMLVDNEQVLEGIFKEAPCMVVTHCEDTPMILALEEQYRQKYGEDVPMSAHPEIRSAEACLKSSSFAIGLAKKHGTRLHVLHLTTEIELDQFEKGPPDNKQITAEACVHHTYFDESDYADKGSLIKCNPAIKKHSDREALRQALADGRLDVIATDHAPHTLEEKANTYFKAPAGLPLVQHALQMALELVHDEVLSLEQVVEKTAHAPARMFGIVERGYLREGYFADLVLVDLQRSETVSRDKILYKCGWSPMEGRTLHSSIAATMVNGQLLYKDGEFVSDVAAGQRLLFNRS